jgi:glycosyltransferase involved in cell wall biosynthesis
MKVALHAGQLLQPVPGGVGRYVRALVQRVPRAGVEVVAFGAGPAPGGLGGKVPWVDLGWPHGSARYEMWHRLHFPPVRVAGDLVHAPSLAVPPRGRRPLVVTAHDVAFLRFPDTTTPRGRRFHERGLKLARRDADVVIAPSQFTRAELVTEGFDPRRVHVIPHGFDPPAERADDEVDAIVAAMDLHAPYVLAVGTIEPRKNLSTLAEAFSIAREKHPELTLVLVGPTGWGTVTGLDRPGVIRLGAVPWTALDALYRRCAICCLVSHYEGFGLPAVEAMARRAPLVASNNGAVAEAVGDAALTVDPNDVDGIAAGIMRILEDEDVRSVLTERGPIRASEFTWARAATLHAEAYAAVAERLA